MKLMMKMGRHEAESSPFERDEPQSFSSSERVDEQWNQRTDDQQLELALMSPPSVFSPAPLNELDMSLNMLDEQPRRKTNPLARSVHQTLKMEELNEKI